MNLHPDFTHVLQAVKLHSLDVYSINGQQKRVSDVKLLNPDSLPDFEQANDLEVPLELLRILESDIYNSLYKGTPHGPDSGWMDPQDHLQALYQANKANGGWERGWKLDESGLAVKDRLAVSKGRVRFYAELDEVHFLDKENCLVRVPKELRKLNSYYFMVFGDAEDLGKKESNDLVLRYYWHLQPGAAPEYIEAITNALMDIKVPFRTKVLKDPERYTVRDAGVLYVAHRHQTRVENTVLEIADLMRENLRDDPPLFTQKLAPGLGFALDPGNGMSFGMHLSRLLALALIRSHLLGFDSLSAQSSELIQLLRQAGILPELPFYCAHASSFTSTHNS